uniref:Mitochondrial import receptor subunit TOM20 homolog n=1 Tax=Rhabditophanes sp. KR3021 TaxID=114890 RepID=A0AC35UHN0_9BILA
MTSETGSKWLLYSAVAGAAVLTTAAVLDYIRRSDPEYKKKLRERRKNETVSGGCNIQLPKINLKDAAAVQDFFIQEVQRGEELMASGNITEGVEHIAMAVNLCGYPQQLLQVFQQTFPPDQFDLLLERIPITREVVRQLLSETEGDVQDVTEEEKAKEVSKSEESKEEISTPLLEGSFGTITPLGDGTFSLVDEKELKEPLSGNETPEKIEFVDEQILD